MFRFNWSKVKEFENKCTKCAYCCFRTYVFHMFVYIFIQTAMIWYVLLILMFWCRFLIPAAKLYFPAGWAQDFKRDEGGFQRDGGFPAGPRGIGRTLLVWFERFCSFAFKCWYKSSFSLEFMGFIRKHKIYLILLWKVVFMLICYGFGPIELDLHALQCFVVCFDVTAFLLLPLGNPCVIWG